MTQIVVIQLAAGLLNQLIAVCKDENTSTFGGSTQCNVAENHGLARAGGQYQDDTLVLSKCQADVVHGCILIVAQHNFHCHRFLKRSFICRSAPHELVVGDGPNYLLFARSTLTSACSSSSMSLIVFGVRSVQRSGVARAIPVS
ncbi:hypothetical protein D3C75_799000 [compost metagenome]